MRTFDTTPRLKVADDWRINLFVVDGNNRVMAQVWKDEVAETLWGKIGDTPSCENADEMADIRDECRFYARKFLTFDLTGGDNPETFAAHRAVDGTSVADFLLALCEYPRAQEWTIDMEGTFSLMLFNETEPWEVEIKDGWYTENSPWVPADEPDRNPAYKAKCDDFKAFVRRACPQGDSKCAEAAAELLTAFDLLTFALAWCGVKYHAEVDNALDATFGALDAFHRARLAAQIAPDHNGEILAAIKAEGEETRSVIRAHFPNRQADCQVTQEQLAKLLAGMNCPKDRKTINRWEKYLETNGKEGNKPPAGYTLQTRLTLQAATAWADSYAAAENGKLKTKISFEARFGGRT